MSIFRDLLCIFSAQDDKLIHFTVYQAPWDTSLEYPHDTLWSISWDPVRIIQNLFLTWDRELKPVVLSTMKPIDGKRKVLLYNGVPAKIKKIRPKISFLNFSPGSYIQKSTKKLVLINIKILHKSGGLYHQMCLVAWPPPTGPCLLSYRLYE